MNIEFPGQTNPAPDGGVYFRALVDGKSMGCHVTLEALEDHFGTSTQRSPVEAFDLGRDRIYEAAIRLIQAGAPAPVLIRYRDIR